MQINRHNYEAFFLLYVDKELSAADRKAVDVFVKENPDLQMELWALQQTVVKAEDIVLDKKDWLYMQEDITALQEDLLLYADDELTAFDKKSVESVLATDKAAQAEWNILQQTKLQPDMAVVFEDKQSLYRKEGGRLVSFKWWRAVAAAAILVFGFLAGVSVYKNTTKTTTGSAELATDNKARSQQVKTNLPAIATTTASKEKSTTENIVSATTQIKNNKALIEKIKPANEKIKEENKAAATAMIVEKKSNDKKRGNELTKSYLEKINNRESNKTIVAGVINENNNSSRVSGNNDAAGKMRPKEKTTNTFIADGNNSKTDQNAVAVQVVNNKTTDGENKTRYLNVDEDKEKRTTLAGFLRKAKRVIERTTSVKAGEGIKIAGFEIAL